MIVPILLEQRRCLVNALFNVPIQIVNSDLNFLESYKLFDLHPIPCNRGHVA